VHRKYSKVDQVYKSEIRIWVNHEVNDVEQPHDKKLLEAREEVPLETLQ
jgi:hypothetical protein